MNTRYNFTDTAQDLARAQLDLTRYQSAQVTEDSPNVTLLSRNGTSVVIYTYLDQQGNEFLGFTSYLPGQTVPYDCGECALRQAPTVLAGLAHHYT